MAQKRTAGNGKGKAAAPPPKLTKGARLLRAFRGDSTLERLKRRLRTDITISSLSRYCNGTAAANRVNAVKLARGPAKIPADAWGR